MRAYRLAAILLLTALPAVAGQVFSLSRAETTVTVLPGTQMVPLADSLIAVGSDSLTLAGRPLTRGREYLIDYGKGTLTLMPAPGDTAVLVVRYVRVPLFSHRRFAHRTLTRSAPGDSAPPLQPVDGFAEAPPADDGNDLLLYGSKTFGISMGSRSAFAVEQALNLNIRGTVARDVRITASLSDQSTPIPPEGDTRTLRELDGVRILAEGRNVSVEMGNLDIDFTGTEFGNYRKRLEGARAALALPRAGMNLCGARSEGQFSTAAFAGTDGKQGPYFLPGANGESTFNILPGTEKIWVDGQEMVRGRENDYVIDYGDGSVTFTNRRLITGESRITADYEYFQGAYRRSLYAGGGYLKLFGGRLKLDVTVVYEGDDGDSPLETGTLNDTARAALAGAGDNPLAAIDPSGGIWADTAGAYYLHGDTLIDTVAGSGTHSAAFTYVGAGRGDYTYLPGSGRYRFVGTGLGEFLPVTLVPLPQSRMLADFRAVVQPVPAVTVTAELALTEEDLNTMSSLDDGDNIGNASMVKMSVEPGSLSVGTHYAGTVRLDGGYRRTGSRFAPPGRVTGVEEFERQWSLTPEPGRTVGMLDGAAVYRYRNLFAAGGELGQLEQFGLSGHLRRKGFVRAGAPDLPELRLDWQDAGGGGDDGRYWERHTAAGSYPLGFLVPEGGLEREYYSGSVDRVFDNTNAHNYLICGYTTGIGTRGAAGGTLAGAVRYGQRAGERHSEPYFEARTLQIDGALRDWRSTTGQVAFTRRDKVRFTDDGNENNRTYLATAKAEAAPFKRGVTADVRYEVTSTQNARKKEVFRRVDAYGQYSYDIDDLTGDTLWIADAEGDYVRDLVAVGEYRPSVEVKGSAALTVSPRRWLKKKKGKAGAALRAFSSSTRYTFGQLSLAEGFGADVFLPSYRTPDTSRTLRRELDLRQDLTWEPAAVFSLRLRYRQGRTDNWEDYAGGFVRRIDERGLRLRTGRETVFSNETELVLAEERVTQGVSTPTDIASRDIKSTLFRKFTPRTEGSAGLQYRTDTERISGLESSMYAFKPGVRHSLGRTGRITIDAEAVNVTEPTASYRQLAGNRQGWTYRMNLLFDYRVNQFVTYYVTYNLVDEPYDGDRRVTQQGRAEVRASF